MSDKHCVAAANKVREELGRSVDLLPSGTVLGTAAVVAIRTWLDSVGITAEKLDRMTEPPRSWADAIRAVQP